MGQITTNAIVLRRVDYRENDRMLTLFSPTLGRIDALCRGCRRQKSPLMAASELFCTGEYVLYQARNEVDSRQRVHPVTRDKFSLGADCRQVHNLVFFKDDIHRFEQLFALIFLQLQGQFI